MRSSLLQASLTLWVLAAASLAGAQDDGTHHLSLWHRLHQEGTPPPGKPRLFLHTDHGAGYARGLASHLEPSTTPGGIGYYGGGGIVVEESFADRSSQFARPLLAPRRIDTIRG